MFRFCLLLFGELLLLPILYLKEFLKKHISISEAKSINRLPVVTDQIIAGIHDWAGYELLRKKTVNNIEFDCGLQSQLNRINNYKGKKNIKLSLTISGSDQDNYAKYEDIIFVKVSNIGMDFQGYAHTINSHANESNCYVLLMNSSVEAKQIDFIDEYIHFLENNPHVGLLGISYATQMYQTIIRNNFTPHIQSFFLLTTLDVMNKVVERNNGTFPGQDISHKRLLIRYGEVKLSQIISDLGYSLAVVPEGGKPYVFPKSIKWTRTAYKQWALPMGEYRFHVKHPNRINKIVKDN